MTGYELKTKHFDSSLSYFWPADQAQIYRTLERLKRDGWVESELQVQTDRPNRKQYHITDAGNLALHSWLAESRPIAAERRAFLVQLYFARHLSQEDLLAVLEGKLQQHQERLAQYEAIALPETDDPMLLRQLIFGSLTLDYGLRYQRMQIEWLQNVLAQVREMPA